MASNDATTFPSFHPDHFLDQEADGSKGDMPVAKYPSPHPVSDKQGGPRTDMIEGEGGVGGGNSSSRKPQVIPDAGTARVCRTERAAYREAVAEKAWEMRRSEIPVATKSRVLVRPARGRSSKRRMRMDLEEVKACRDLGIELPRDWTYEISVAADRPRSSTTARGSRFSIPGGDPRDMKAKLMVWAHAVAAASASRLGT